MKTASYVVDAAGISAAVVVVVVLVAAVVLVVLVRWSNQQNLGEDLSVPGEILLLLAPFQTMDTLV